MRETRSSRPTGVVAAVLRAMAAAIVGLAGTVSLLQAQPAPGPDRRPVVAVLDYYNSAIGQKEDYGPLGKGMALALASRLGETKAVRLVTREKLREIRAEHALRDSGLVDPSQAIRTGRLLNAHHIISGTFWVQPNGRTRLTGSAHNVETSEMEYATSVDGNAKDMQALLDKLADRMADGMRLPEAETRAPDVGAPRTGNLSDLVIFSRAVDAEDRGRAEEATPLYKLFLAKAPATSFAAQRRLAGAKAEPRRPASGQ